MNDAVRVDLDCFVFLFGAILFVHGQQRVADAHIGRVRAASCDYLKVSASYQLDVFRLDAERRVHLDVFEPASD